MTGGALSRKPAHITLARTCTTVGAFLRALTVPIASQQVPSKDRDHPETWQAPCP